MNDPAQIPDKYKHKTYFQDRTWQQGLRRGWRMQEAHEVLDEQIFDSPLEQTSAALPSSPSRRSSSSQIVNSTPEYQAVAEHAGIALHAMRLTQAGRRATCLDLYKTLLSSECEDCGGFGEFLFVLSCKRLCGQCLRKNPSYRPITKDELKALFGLKPAKAKHMRQMKGCVLPCWLWRHPDRLSGHILRLSVCSRSWPGEIQWQPRADGNVRLG
ncbi:hypothetical protein PT974_07458 [Cladobotryum mycophilum]|uniref:Uncharacterized protein n=1 Tax=Cladobotryum mycophilum TaxID=491253 RepID=A0ABR0SPB2_9HYPO